MRGSRTTILALLLGCAAGDVGDDADGGEAGVLPPLKSPAPDALRFNTPARDGGTVTGGDDAGEPVRPPPADAGARPDAGGGPDAEDAPPADAAPRPDPAPDAGSPDCLAEICDGADQDCDGVIDEGGVCGPYVAAHCVLYLGWADDERYPRGVAAQWGQCPAQDRYADADVRCAGTRRDGRFGKLDLGGDVNGDDGLGLALRCEDAANPELARWFQTRCAVYLGWADNNRGPDASFSWGACPEAAVSNAGDLRCTSTGGDGNFRALDLAGDVDGNDDLGLAWICRDPGDAARAAAQTAAVEVFLGWADRNRGPADGSATWGPCPAAVDGRNGDPRCVGTRGDGRFHRLDLGGDVNGDDDLGFAIRAREVR